MHNVIKIVGMLLVTSGLLSACGNHGGQDGNAGRAPLALLKLQATDDCGPLENYVTESLFKRLTQSPYAYCPGNVIFPPVLKGVPEAAGAAASDSLSTVSDTQTDFVSTNTQESGVQEGDIVKRDKNYLYTIRSVFDYSAGKNINEFIMTKVVPAPEVAAPWLVHRITLDSDYVPSALFLDPDQTKSRAIVVATRSYFYAYLDVMGTASRMASDAVIGIWPPIPPQPPKTKVYFIQIDRNQMDQTQIAKSMEMEGSYVDARQIRSRLHLVSHWTVEPPPILRNNPDLCDSLWAYYEKQNQTLIDPVNGPVADSANLPVMALSGNETLAQLEQNIKNIIKTEVSNQGVLSLMPKRQFDNEAQASPVYQSCGNIHHPKIQLDLAIKTITSMDSDGANMQTTGIINNAYMIYGSKENLYLVQNHYGWWWDNVQRTPQTAIYQFNIADDTQPARYVAAGSVDGTARNSFNFSEYQGVLRVVTQEDYWRPNTGRETHVHLTTLMPGNTGELVKLGEKRNFIENETVESVRFVKNLGFVVTQVRRIDPLFVFDLTDPAQPRQLADLKIPGFSTYIHPLYNNTGDVSHLITIGESESRDLQIQLFDVTDLNNPKQADIVVETPGNLGYSSSEAQYDHMAFTYDPVHEVLSIPVRLNTYYANQFTGALVYRVSPQSGITPLGKVNHHDLVKTYFNGADLSCGYYYGVAPRRSFVYAGDAGHARLFTMSNLGIIESDVPPGLDVVVSKSGQLTFDNPNLETCGGGGVIVN